MQKGLFRKILKKIRWVTGIILSFLALATGRKIISGNKKTKTKEEEVFEKCEKKRNETINRINSVPARELAESYGSVCDVITEGKLRFRKRIEFLSGSGNERRTGDSDGNM